MPNTDRDLAHLHPEFRAKVEALLNDVRAECASKVGPLSGLEFIILETLRSFARSNELYAQGRKLVKGVWQVINKAAIVTNAPGGYSFHNYGRALDGGPKYKDKPFSWDWPSDPKLMAAMRRTAVLAARHGIEWGGNWVKLKDLPHFQDAGAPSIQTLRKSHPEGWIPGGAA